MKIRLNLRKMVAVTICLIGCATLFAQEETGVNINGVIWATRNVGAPGTFVDKPEDAGMFYQWGGNVGWSSTDPLINSNGSNIWETNSMSGDTWTTNNDPCPTGWRVPTDSEISKMQIGNIIPSTWTTLNGVNGRIFGIHPNTIFLPAAGYRYWGDGDLLSVDNEGYYWGGEEYDEQLGWVGRLRFTKTQTSFKGTSRTYGYCVRCVKDASTSISNFKSENINVYPNPTVGMVYIETESNIKLYNIQGVLLKESFGNQIDLSDCPQGLYFLQIDGKTTKIIKN